MGRAKKQFGIEKTSQHFPTHYANLLRTSESNRVLRTPVKLFCRLSDSWVSGCCSSVSNFCLFGRLGFLLILLIRRVRLLCLVRFICLPCLPTRLALLRLFGSLCCLLALQLCEECLDLGLQTPGLGLGRLLRWKFDVTLTTPL